PGPVPLRGAGLGAFVTVSADRLGRFDLDQLLQHETDRFPDEIHAVTGTERVEQLGHGRLRQSHRLGSPSVRSGRNTPRITPMAHPRVDAPAPKPHHVTGRSQSPRTTAASTW